jgi:PAS domain S-box-containing protein
LSMRFWPRSIRWQMLASLVLLEALSIALFAALLVHEEAREVQRRAEHRLAHQATSLALQAQEALQQQRSDWVSLSVKMLGDAPSVAFAKITDPAGNVLFASDGNLERGALSVAERTQIPSLSQQQPMVFNRGGDRWEGAKAIYTGADLRGYAWVETDQDWDSEQLNSILRGTVLFGVIWILASALLVLWLTRAISRPLNLLLRGTRALMDSPETVDSFPLPMTVNNEIGDLIEAFNRMVASIDEQRSGLHDTLSLLDSMLANAPVGLAFFDRRCRFVRVNQVFADLTGIPLSRHLGRTLPELLPQPVAQQLEDAVLRAFALEEPVRDLELTGQSGRLKRPWTWLASAYPVRTDSHQARWAGIVVMDATERKLSEDAMRKTEKLAATGRLAASIAHEINNPLEAITNLLFLLRNFCVLENPALNYVEMAEIEIRRISEITQQTLRFYRQSTLPARANVSELINSVLTLFHGRMHNLAITVECRYDPEMDLFCFAGEVRQVFANLIGNSIDAAGAGTRMLIRARRSRNWVHPEQTGIRFVVADTGSGMDPEVRERVFEAFFTTKETTGTGLGLWVSHEIVLKHHGLIHLRSRTAHSGKTGGTVFQLFIPDNEDLTAPAKKAAVTTA